MRPIFTFAIVIATASCLTASPSLAELLRHPDVRRNLGDEILPVTFSGTSVQGCATRDSQTGEIIVKLVNPELTPQALPIEIKDVTALASKATVITLSANPEDTNSIRARATSCPSRRR